MDYWTVFLEPPQHSHLITLSILFTYSPDEINLNAARISAIIRTCVGWSYNYQSWQTSMNFLLLATWLPKPHETLPLHSLAFMAASKDIQVFSESSRCSRCHEVKLDTIFSFTSHITSSDYNMASLEGISDDGLNSPCDVAADRLQQTSLASKAHAVPVLSWILEPTVWGNRFLHSGHKRTMGGFDFVSTLVLCIRLAYWAAKWILWAYWLYMDCGSESAQVGSRHQIYPARMMWWR